MISILYVILAGLGLGFLVFIHEYGHYYVARKVGMRVEVFSIGFGKPIYSWKKNGVRWQIGWLLFGGYVRFAGTEKVNGIEPSDIPDGFFGKKPWDRIRVALAGPLVNLFFALLVFTFLWGIGGREKTFEDFTNIVGWADPQSVLYAEGLRPGDKIISYDDHPFTNSKDHIYAALLSGDAVVVKGMHENYPTGEETPFSYEVAPYDHPLYWESGLLTTGVLSPARYMIYTEPPKPNFLPLLEGSPMEYTDLQFGDRLFWVDGMLLFSLAQLKETLNDGKALLTVQHGDQTFLRRVPRLPLGEFRLDVPQREELNDWQHEVTLKGDTKELMYIPYDLNLNCQVEGVLSFIDKDDENRAFPKHVYSSVNQRLEPGDIITAVDGQQVHKSYEILNYLQSRQVHIVVERVPDLATDVINWEVANENFDRNINWGDLHTLTNSIGASTPIKAMGTLQLLEPVVPLKLLDFPMSKEQKAEYIHSFKEKYQELEQIPNQEERERLIVELNKTENTLMLGIRSLQDRPVLYNPGPFQLCENLLKETGRTLASLFIGDLDPKWLSGPVGIVQVMQYSWSIGVKEALFWLASISFSLGLINLFPIPALDGGYICLSFIEMFTKKPFKAKTIEKLVLPFILLLVALFIFLTYHDLQRLLFNFF